ncbi:hypothetical protein BC834DRAFT_192783 [Gloeopeniophorella convolvens]|nr:hypothetical protein BC834DRAFT_192783 [Gloeopeniophorella convolvens]
MLAPSNTIIPFAFLDLSAFPSTVGTPPYPIHPVRDLNNFLQGQPGGNLAQELLWKVTKTGPEHSTTFHVTATFRGVDIGVGHGTSRGSAKRDASVQALQYLRSNGLSDVNDTDGLAPQRRCSRVFYNGWPQVW